MEVLRATRRKNNDWIRTFPPQPEIVFETGMGYKGPTQEQLRSGWSHIADLARAMLAGQSGGLGSEVMLEDLSVADCRALAAQGKNIEMLAEPLAKEELTKTGEPNPFRKPPIKTLKEWEAERKRVLWEAGLGNTRLAQWDYFLNGSPPLEFAAAATAETDDL